MHTYKKMLHLAYMDEDKSVFFGLKDENVWVGTYSNLLSTSRL